DILAAKSFGKFLRPPHRRAADRRRRVAAHRPRDGSRHPDGVLFGLEDWRDWYRAAQGEQPWLGHDPWPTAIPDGSEVVFTADSEIDNPATIRAPVTEVLDLLAMVEGRLAEFARACTAWAVSAVPSYGQELMKTLKQALDLDSGPCPPSEEIPGY